MKNILIISYHYPPNRNSQAQHVFNIVKILRQDYMIHVLTSNKEDYNHLDNVDVHRIGTGFLHPDSESKQYQYQKRSIKKWLFKNFKYILKFILMPDSVIDWYPVAKKWLSRNIIDYDLVISVSTPYTDLLLGNYYIKKFKNKSKYICIYADPWYSEVSVKKNILRQIIERHWEKIVLKNNDWIFFVTKNTMQLYKKEFPKYSSKMKYYYLGHNINDEKIKVNRKMNYSCLYLRYFGSIQNVHRNPYPLLNALDNPAYVEKIRMDLFLLPHSSHQKIFKKIQCSENLKRIVSIKDSVDYEKMLEIGGSCGVNIIFGNKSITQIPGKLYDYIGLKSKILYLRENTNSEIERLLGEYKNANIVDNNKESINGYFLSYLNNPITFFNYHPSDKIWLQLKSTNCYKSLIFTIKNILGPNK